jgi:putative membrane protein
MRRTTGLTAILISLGNAPLLAHPGRPPAPHDIWQAWSWEPGVLLALAISGWLYLRGVRTLWSRAGRRRVVTAGRVRLFFAGLGVLFLALVTPLDKLGTALFSAHMVQHLLLVLAAAPLLILGAPNIAIVWAFPLDARRALADWWHRARWLKRIWWWLSRPLVVWVLHTAAMWAWHLPGPYQAALRSEAVHALEHASFFLTALLFWWVLARPDYRRRLSFGADLVFLFTAAMQGGVLGALITFARQPWYPMHAEPASWWGLTALEDQQLAGLIMWVPASLVYLAAAAVVLLNGLARLDGKALRVAWERPPA